MTPAASDRSQVLLCTGSFASQPPGIPFDNKRILDADSVNGLSFLPKSVVVAGSGIIAIEMANIFRCGAAMWPRPPPPLRGPATYSPLPPRRPRATASSVRA